MTADGRLGHYELHGLLGAGAMGEVYRATDTKLGRAVALKVLPAAFAHDPERLARFRQEAKALAALDHPGVVTVYSVEHVESAEAGAAVHFLTMQLVEGESLDRVLHRTGAAHQGRSSVARRISRLIATGHGDASRD